MAGFSFADRRVAEVLRDSVRGITPSLPSGQSVPVQPMSRFSGIIGFHAVSGIPGSTTEEESSGIASSASNPDDPTLVSYASALCDVYSLSWDSETSKHVPLARTDENDVIVQAYVINATSAAIAAGSMVWGLPCVGTRDGTPVFMAVVGDCGA